MHRFSCILTAIIAFGTCPSLLMSAPPKTVVGKGYEIYAPSDALMIQTEQFLLDAINDAQSMLGDTVQQTIRVSVISSRDEFNRAVHGGLPDWGVGCAIPSRDEIFLLSPKAEDYGKSFGEIVRHEWAHIALRHKAGSGYLPRFIDEGFAMMFADQWNIRYAATLAKAQFMDNLFSLRSIDRVNFFNMSQAQIAYAQSHEAVVLFINTYGELAFEYLLEELRAGKTPDLAFEDAIGIRLDGFEAEYRKYIERHYSWHLILTDMGFIWIALALLIVVGFVVKKLSGKKTVKRWEEEEKYESTDFDYEEGDPWD
jgi:hypothetical protein